MKHAFLDHHSQTESPIHHLDARAKIIVFFTFILIGVSSPPTSFLLFSLLAMTLIGIALFARLPLGHLLKKVLVILPFLFVVTISIPFMKKDVVGGGYNLGLGGLSISQSGLWILWNVVIKSCWEFFLLSCFLPLPPFPN